MNQVERRKQEIKARSRHRNRYWNEHDRDTYSCPHCGATAERTRQFDVHHRDGNPLNGNPENLVALCYECHLAEHGCEKRKETLDEWKERGATLGSDEAQVTYSRHMVYSQSIVADGGGVAAAEHDQARERGLARRLCDAMEEQP